MLLLFIGKRVAWTVALLLAISLATYITFFILPTNRATALRRTGTDTLELRRAIPLSGNVLQE